MARFIYGLCAVSALDTAHVDSYCGGTNIDLEAKLNDSPGVRVPGFTVYEAGAAFVALFFIELWRLMAREARVPVDTCATVLHTLLQVRL